MLIFLPIAGLSINLSLLVGVGLVIGFLSGLLGVGGGFLLTPILMMIGITPTVAAASSSNTIVAASASGVAAHFRLGNVDIKIGSILLLGGLTGGAIGVQLIEILRTWGEASLVITSTYILVLGGVGGYTIVKSLRRRLMTGDFHGPAKTQSILDRLPFQMNFPHSGVQYSFLVPFGVSAMVGILASMGMGGGFVLVPMMVYLLRMPARVAVGTSLFQIMFTCAGVTFMEATTNHTVDLMLVLLLALGSTVGAQIGAHVSRLLHGHQLMVLLGILLLVVMLEMVTRIVRVPSNLLSEVIVASAFPHR